jgi:hypothetical protein
MAAVERPMLAIEVHRHPAITAILDVRGIDGGLDLVAADRERQSAVYSGLQATLYARLVTQKLPFTTPTASGRNGWGAAIRCGAGNG